MINKQEFFINYHAKFAKSSLRENLSLAFLAEKRQASTKRCLIVPVIGRISITRSRGNIAGETPRGFRFQSNEVR